MIQIYALARAGTVFYVGQTGNLEQRSRHHRSNWGRDISIVVLDSVADQETANLAERAWIMYYAHRGKLHNIAGNPFYERPRYMPS